MASPVQLPEWFTFPIVPPYLMSSTPTFPTDEDSRSRALSAAAAHDDAVAALQRLSEENGGGLMGVVKGVLPDYERLGLITAADRARLMSCFEALRAAQSSDEGRAGLPARIQTLLQEGIADTTSKPAALAVLSIVASDTTPSQADSGVGHVVGTVLADAGGALLGLPGGPITTFMTSTATSEVAEHIHVDVHWH